MPPNQILSESYNKSLRQLSTINDENIEMSALTKTARIPLLQYQTQKNISLIVAKSTSKLQRCWLPHNYVYTATLINLRQPDLSTDQPTSKQTAEIQKLQDSIYKSLFRN
jgi:hypothetical protein